MQLLSHAGLRGIFSQGMTTRSQAARRGQARHVALEDDNDDNEEDEEDEDDDKSE